MTATAEEIVRALASIGDDALARLEEASATCKSIEEASGDGRGHFIRPGEEARADTELAAAREIIAAPYRLAVEWVAAREGEKPTACTRCACAGTVAKSLAANWNCQADGCGGQMVRVRP